MVVVPHGATLRRRKVAATWLPLAEVIDALVALPAGSAAGRSTQAWAHAARAALVHVARGRILPTADADGTDLWRVGPLDATDLAHWRALAEALPPHAHATEVADARAPAGGVAGLAAGPLPRRRGRRLRAHRRRARRRRPRRLRRPRAGGGGRVGLVAGGHRRRGHRRGRPRACASTPGGSGGVRPPTRATGPAERTAARPRGRRASRTPTSGPCCRSPAAEIRAWCSMPPSCGPPPTPWPSASAPTWSSRSSWPCAGAPGCGRRSAACSPKARPAALELDGAEVDDLLGPAAEGLAGSGIDVLWPAGLLASVTVTPTVTSTAPTADRAAGLGFDSLCELRWSATVDGEQLTDDELHELATAKRSVIRLRGRWVRADPKRLERLQQRHKVTAGAALAAALGGDLLVDGESVSATVQGPIADLATRLGRIDEQRDVEPPDDLTGRAAAVPAPGPVVDGQHGRDRLRRHPRRRHGPGEDRAVPGPAPGPAGPPACPPWWSARCR